uniref:Guanylate cyclase domain-containing protein n=1 Tax=Dunaliella tertiolecta TaxID=3047 RepID=A0A7S3QV24_DUNTE
MFFPLWLSVAVHAHDQRCLHPCVPACRDTMNTSARMESTGAPNRIHVSAATYALLLACEDGGWEATGGVQVKGKGFMQTYFWVPPEGDFVSPAPSSPFALSASNSNPTNSANTNVTSSADTAAVTASPAQHLAAGAITSTEGAHAPLEAVSPRPAFAEATSACPLPTGSVCAAEVAEAAAHVGVMGGAGPSGLGGGGSSSGAGASVPQKGSEKSASSISLADTAGLGSAYMLGAANSSMGHALAHVGSRRVRHLSLDPALLGAQGMSSPRAAGAVMVGSASQDEGQQPAGQGYANVTTPRGAAHPSHAHAFIMGAPPGYLSRVGSSSGMVRCGGAREARRSLSSATGRGYRSTRCFSHRVTSYNGSMADTMALPGGLRSGHGSLDQHLLRSRVISHSTNSHPPHDLQQVMDSFYDFNHRAILDQGPSDQHGPRELPHGGGGSGERHDPLRVILRALPVQNMSTTFGQRTPSYTLQSPNGRPLTPKLSLPSD